MAKVVEKKASDLVVEVNWNKAREIARQARGIPLPVGPGSPDLAEILVKAPQVTSTPPWAPLDYEQENTTKSTPSEDKRVDNEEGVPPS
jgi:hypothetical protein